MVREVAPADIGLLKRRQALAAEVLHRARVEALGVPGTHARRDDDASEQPERAGAPIAPHHLIAPGRPWAGRADALEQPLPGDIVREGGDAFRVNRSPVRV